MKRTKMIIIISTIAIFGTAGIVYYFYRRNKTLLNEVKQLKRDTWCKNNNIDSSETGILEKEPGNTVGDNSNAHSRTSSGPSLHSLRSEIETLEDMLSSSEESYSSSEEDVNSEALLQDILKDDDEFSNNVIHVQVQNELFNGTEPEINPLRSYHLDENDDNENLELTELMGAATNNNIENLVQENISKAVINIAVPLELEKDIGTKEDINTEQTSFDDDTVSSNIIEISNMSSQGSIISNTLTLEMKVEILLDKYTKKNLEALCAAQKISKSGSKRVLISRLIESNYDFKLNKITETTQKLNKN